MKQSNAQISLKFVKKIIILALLITWIFNFMIKTKYIYYMFKLQTIYTFSNYFVNTLWEEKKIDAFIINKKIVNCS